MEVGEGSTTADPSNMVFPHQDAILALCRSGHSNRASLEESQRHSGGFAEVRTHFIEHWLGIRSTRER